MSATHTVAREILPFDEARLDGLLDEAGVDIVMVTSKHNVQYLLGGYRFFFFDYMDAVAESRYLPVLVYQKGRPENAAYFGAALETFEKDLGKFWPATVQTTTWSSTDAVRLAVEHIKKIGGSSSTLGVERPFLPMDGGQLLRDELSGCRVAEATFVLERLRLIKSPAELNLLREASERVVQSMAAVIEQSAPGMTKNDLVEKLRREEVNRGLKFEYCLITAGRDLNRAPSEQKLYAGDILSLDSAGNYHGYIGDLCRMGILGEPDAELVDLLGLIDQIQAEARKPIKPGARGGDIFAVADEMVQKSPHKPHLEFLAHGMGLVSHEGPRLTSTGPVPYQGYDEDRPLESGMVISIETALKHPTRGYVKLEDTVAVTASGCEGFGDQFRGWNRAGTLAKK
ncbi:Xaa-Pro aminopeptidase [Bradyrhizobium sp. USDA 4463]